MTPTFIAFSACFTTLVVLVSVAVLRRREPSSARARAMLISVVAGFAVGTSTHLENLWRAGFVPRPDLPFGYNVFWSSLVFIDPIIAVVLLARPRVGLQAALGIMVLDLCVNLVVLGLTPVVVAQVCFLALIVIALREPLAAQR